MEVPFSDLMKDDKAPSGLRAKTQYRLIDYVYRLHGTLADTAQAKVLYRNYESRGMQPSSLGWQNIDIMVAQQYVRLASEALLELVGPRARPSTMIEQGVCVLKMNTMSCTVSEENNVVAEERSGQLMPLKAKASDVRAAVVSTALAAQYTASIATVTTLSVKDRESKHAKKGETMNVATTKMLAYKEWSINLDLPPNMLWTYDAMANVANARDYYLSQKSVDQARLQSLLTPPQSDARLLATGHTGYQVDDKGIVAPGRCIFGTPKQASLITAYRHLASHRAVRGSDKKHISQLTSGYYLFGMMRDFEEPVMWAIDILNFLNTMKVKLEITTLPKQLHPYTMAILAANGCIVRILTHNASLVNNTITPTQKRIIWVGDYNASIVVLKQYCGAIPYITSQNELQCADLPTSPFGYTKAQPIFAEKKECDKNGNYPVTILTRAFMTTSMKDLQVFPSLHVHAMQVLWCSRPLKTPVTTISEQVLRSITANQYKTMFPWSGTPFALVDKYIPQCLLPGKTGVILPCVKSSKNVAEHVTMTVEATQTQLVEMIAISRQATIAKQAPIPEVQPDEDFVPPCILCHTVHGPGECTHEPVAPTPMTEGTSSADIEGLVFSDETEFEVTSSVDLMGQLSSLSKKTTTTTTTTQTKK